MTYGNGMYIQYIEGLQYIAQIRKGRSWVQLGKPSKTSSKLYGRLMRYSRSKKKSGKNVRVDGRVIASAVVSKQSYSFTPKKKETHPWVQR